MMVTFASDGQTFQLFGLHLASERGGNEQDQHRIAQASIVRRHSLPAINDGTFEYFSDADQRLALDLRVQRTPHEGL